MVSPNFQCLSDQIWDDRRRIKLAPWIVSGDLTSLAGDRPEPWTFPDIWDSRSFRSLHIAQSELLGASLDPSKAEWSSFKHTKARSANAPRRVQTITVVEPIAGVVNAALRIAASG